MDKDLEKLSALYDGELSSKEIQESLTKMNANDGLKNTFQNFGLISDIVQRHSEQKNSKVSFLKDFHCFCFSCFLMFFKVFGCNLLKIFSCAPEPRRKRQTTCVFLLMVKLGEHGQLNLSHLLHQRMYLHL